MTIPVNAVAAGPLREPALPSARAKDSASTREAPLTEAVERAPSSTHAEKKEALKEVNRSLELASIGVRFEFDQEASTLVTKVVDVQSGELIRQMPSEEVVRISRALGKLQGLLLSRRA